MRLHSQHAPFALWFTSPPPPAPGSPAPAQVGSSAPISSSAPPGPPLTHRPISHPPAPTQSHTRRASHACTYVYTSPHLCAASHTPPPLTNTRDPSLAHIPRHARLPSAAHLSSHAHPLHTRTPLLTLAPTLTRAPSLTRALLTRTSHTHSLTRAPLTRRTALPQRSSSVRAREVAEPAVPSRYLGPGAPKTRPPPAGAAR